MQQSISGRREFLLRAGQSIAGVSVLAALPGTISAQKTAAQQASVQPSARATKLCLNVRDLGAKGDGASKDTLVVQQALDRAAVLGGGEVLVPAGVYLCGALVLRSNTTLHLQEGATLQGSPDIADYPLRQVRWEGRWIRGYGAFLSAEDAESVAITGKGKILASQAIKGRVVHEDGSPVVHEKPAAIPAPGTNNVAREDIVRNPALMEFTRCKNLSVSDVWTEGNDMWSTHLVYCEGVTFRGVTVRGGADGIDVDSCRRVAIDGCNFETHDDCISLKSGRGMEGNLIGMPCEDVQITDCTFRDAIWACIGIGSETSGGIRNVIVGHCRFLGARTFSIYIKSRPGRGAFIEDLVFHDLEVSGTGLGFLRINLLSSGLQDPSPVPGLDGIPRAAHFELRNVHVQDVPVLVQAEEIHPAKPLDGLKLDNITGTCGKGIRLANVRNAELNKIQVTGFSGPLLSICNTTGSGLDGAAPLECPKTPEPIAQPAQPYRLK